LVSSHRDLVGNRTAGISRVSAAANHRLLDYPGWILPAAAMPTTGWFSSEPPCDP
jgi:hypothetical protein